MIRSAMRDDHRLVMTHGDLHPRNIMVKWEGDENEGDGYGREKKIRVTALVDWELSGWYPEY
jgi:aminoglycoside phosphotransferase (APT) family kinase protein